MQHEIPVTQSILRDETSMRWQFLEEEADACAVVSERMELLYLNSAGRALALPDWFAKRCFEVLPVSDEGCAFHCPTIGAVSEAEEITYCEESLIGNDAPDEVLGTAVIPLGGTGEDGAKALLVFRHKDPGTGEDAFRRKLLDDARDLHERIATHHA
jgi:hypothetical protein